MRLMRKVDVEYRVEVFLGSWHLLVYIPDFSRAAACGHV